MYKSTCFILLLVGAALGSHQISAATFHLGGDIFGSRQGFEGGVIEIWYDAEESDISFSNGGVRLDFSLSNPSILRFSNVEILNPSSRWDFTQVDFNENRGGILEAASILTSGLPTNGPVLFATMEYELLQKSGCIMSGMSLSPSGLDALYHGALGDVSSMVFIDAPTLFWLPTSECPFPEPSGLTLISSVIAVATMRRSGLGLARSKRLLQTISLRGQ